MPGQQASKQIRQGLRQTLLRRGCSCLPNNPIHPPTPAANSLNGVEAAVRASRALEAGGVGAAGVEPALAGGARRHACKVGHRYSKLVSSAAMRGLR